MAFREVTMLEVKEILRLWLLGVPKKQIAGQIAQQRSGRPRCQDRPPQTLHQ